MPNHCTNLLSCTSGKPIGALIKPYLSEGMEGSYKTTFLDFNKIIPMPEGILKTCNSSSIEEITKQRTPEEIEARQKEEEILHEQNLKDYGHKNWYDWSVAVWDTKWNSYNNVTLEDNFNEVEDLSDLCFQTAWSPPINVIRELAKLIGEPLRMSYYDEGWMFGGVYHVLPDGSETDECYDDPEKCPEELREELDVDYFLGLMEDEE